MKRMEEYAQQRKSPSVQVPLFEPEQKLPRREENEQKQTRLSSENIAVATDAGTRERINLVHVAYQGKEQLLPVIADRSGPPIEKGTVLEQVRGGILETTSCQLVEERRQIEREQLNLRPEIGEENKEQLVSLLDEFGNRFASSLRELGSTSPIKISVEDELGRLIGGEGLYVRPDEMQKNIEENVAAELRRYRNHDEEVEDLHEDIPAQGEEFPEEPKQRSENEEDPKGEPAPPSTRRKRLPPKATTKIEALGKVLRIYEGEGLGEKKRKKHKVRRKSSEKKRRSSLLSSREYPPEPKKLKVEEDTKGEPDPPTTRRKRRPHKALGDYGRDDIGRRGRSEEPQGRLRQEKPNVMSLESAAARWQRRGTFGRWCERVRFDNGASDRKRAEGSSAKRWGTRG